MMDYFKKNPTALMDAIPTPRGEEEDPDFRTGLTPKKGFSFKFGDAGPNRPDTANRLGSAQRRGSAMSGRSLTPGRQQSSYMSPRVGSNYQSRSKMNNNSAQKFQ